MNPERSISEAAQQALEDLHRRIHEPSNASGSRRRGFLAYPAFKWEKAESARWHEEHRADLEDSFAPLSTVASTLPRMDQKATLDELKLAEDSRRRFLLGESNERPLSQQAPEPPTLRFDPLAYGRFLVSKRDREALDLVRVDLQEDLAEMLKAGHGRAFAFVVIWWRSATNFAPFFWRSVKKLLPFKSKWFGWDFGDEDAHTPAKK